jgi:nucleoid-associated protein YgaU
MRQWRAAAIVLCCGGYLLASPRWMPALPSLGWDAWWSWLEADPQRAVTLVASFAVWLIAGWLLVVAGLTLLAASARRSSDLARRALEILTPRVARGLLRILLGAAVAVATGGPAVASSIPATAVSAGALPSLAPVPAPVVAAPELPPLLDLDRPGDVVPKPSTHAPPRPAVRERHLVRPGDTLWDLAAKRLPTGSSPATITRAWQRWYTANRQEIGADPGLLLVGEVLLVPQDSP